MSRDLVVLVSALALAAGVVVVGLRRNLSEVTRNGLPRFGGDPERATATLGLYRGEERRRRPLSLRQRRWFASLYLLFALVQAASAVLSSHDRVIHVATAGLFVLAAVVLLTKGPGRRAQARVHGRS